MSSSVGAALPPSRFAQLGPAALPEGTLVIPLCTVDDAGFPHLALLGAWEVVAPDAGTLCFAVAGASRSARHLRRDGRATLALVDARGAHYVKVRAREVAPAMRAAPWNARFQARVEDVLADAVDPGREGRSDLVHGIEATADPSAEPMRAGVRTELLEP